MGVSELHRILSVRISRNMIWVQKYGRTHPKLITLHTHMWSCVCVHTQCKLTIYIIYYIIYIISENRGIISPLIIILAPSAPHTLSLILIIIILLSSPVPFLVWCVCSCCCDWGWTHPPPNYQHCMHTSDHVCVCTHSANLPCIIYYIV